MIAYYLVRFEFTTPEAEAIDERQSGELQVYCNSGKEAVEIVRGLLPTAHNFTALKVEHVEHY